jgi:hypothetical protein
MIKTIWPRTHSIFIGCRGGFLSWASPEMEGEAVVELAVLLSAFHNYGHVVARLGQWEGLYIDIFLLVLCLKVIALHEFEEEVLVFHLGKVHADALVRAAAKGEILECVLFVLVALR